MERGMETERPRKKIARGTAEREGVNTRKDGESGVRDGGRCSKRMAAWEKGGEGFK